MAGNYTQRGHKLRLFLHGKRNLRPRVSYNNKPPVFNKEHFSKLSSQPFISKLMDSRIKQGRSTFGHPCKKIALRQSGCHDHEK